MVRLSRVRSTENRIDGFGRAFDKGRALLQGGRNDHFHEAIAVELQVYTAEIQRYIRRLAEGPTARLIRSMAFRALSGAVGGFDALFRILDIRGGV